MKTTKDYHSHLYEQDIGLCYDKCFCYLNQVNSFFELQLVKFGIGQDWVPMKYDVSIDMPEVLDLSVLRGFGLQEGEEELPETTAPPPKGKKTNHSTSQVFFCILTTSVREHKNVILTQVS